MQDLELPIIAGPKTAGKSCSYNSATPRCLSAPGLASTPMRSFGGRDRVLGRTRVIGWTNTLTVSPDGSTVLVRRNNSTTDLVLIENFR